MCKGGNVIMKFEVNSSPHIRSNNTTQKIMLNVVIALLPTLLVGVVIFGVQALVLTLVSVAVAVAAEWNKLGVVTLQSTSSLFYDVKLSDYYDSESNSPFAITSYNGVMAMTVEYNTYHMDSMTSNERIHTILHEFGHVLGITEFTGLEDPTINVMHQGRLNITRLGRADIAVYRSRWGWPEE